eukprot:TRINITY_DN9718_c0_g1_i3.p1 TRINITY_DN9718_c0_g1~~TRINITY_DN9718_c0_g1_i3.p1  ORF type:complete len:506 (-),score=99.80 TRINITY_DN9718_c0_g1_i3:60-1577(-)
MCIRDRFRLNFSNFYRTKKTYLNLRSIQLPVSVEAKWTIVCVDLKECLHDLIVAVETKASGEAKVSKTASVDFLIKSILLTSKMSVRSVYLSNILYNPKTLPKEMEFLLPKDVPFDHHFGFVNCPSGLGVPDNRFPRPMKKDDSWDEEDERLLRAPVPEEQDTGLIKERRDNRGIFELEPNPIMRLAHIHGAGAVANGVQALDRGLLLYAAKHNLICLDLETKQQRFYQSQTRPVSTFCLDRKENLILSGDAEGRIYLWSIHPPKLELSFDAGGLHSIHTMDLATSETRGTDKRLVKTITLLIAGKDQLNRNVVAFVDVTSHKTTVPRIVARQISDFDIVKVAFLERTSNKSFISCGRENIRLWILRSAQTGEVVLRGKSIALNEHAKGATFTDFSIMEHREPDFSHPDREIVEFKVIVVSNKGNVYVVDFGREELLAVYKLHDAAITCVKSPSTVIFTGGDDHTLRLWKLDFSSALLELKLDASAMGISLLSEDEVVVLSLIHI